MKHPWIEIRTISVLGITLVLVMAGALVITAMVGAARGEVVDISASGFTTRNTAVIAAPPSMVYVRLVDDIGKWWSPEHTYSKNAANLSIEARAGGSFLETLPGGGSVLHFAVVNAEPGKLLRLSGAMGPLQSMGVSGSLTWQLMPEGDRTQVVLTYAVGGYLPGGFDKIAPVADKVLAEQLGRLKAYIEKR